MHSITIFKILVLLLMAVMILLHSRTMIIIMDFKLNLVSYNPNRLSDRYLMYPDSNQFSDV